LYELPTNDAEMIFGDNLNNDDIDAEPLYPGASVTTGALMLLKAFFSYWRWSGTTFENHRTCTTKWPQIVHYPSFFQNLLKEFTESLDKTLLLC
jgi:hypothetical protein